MIPSQFAFSKGSVAHSIAALLLALRDTGKSAQEIVEGVEIVHTMLQVDTRRVAVPVWPCGEEARELISEIEGDERST